MNRRHETKGRSQRPSSQRGLTLLELMLSLALTSLVLVAISMAIDLHLRMLDSRRSRVERSQLARAVLQRIASDLRGTVTPSNTDFSAISQMASSALGDIGAGGDAGALGDTGALEEMAGGLADGDVPDLDALDNAAASALGLEDPTASGASEDIAASSEPPAVPGLYGNQYELQMDVSRLPRVDEFERMISSDAMQTVQDIPSDLKTVAYYLQDMNNLPTTTTTDPFGRAVPPQPGLVRRVLDRSVTLQADESGNVNALQNLGEVLSPEVVAAEFEYYDGTEWMTEWDSDELGGLPVAVRITIALGDPALINGTRDPLNNLSISSFTANSTTNEPQEVYSLVVRLPTAQPIDTSEASGDSGLESVGL